MMIAVVSEIFNLEEPPFGKPPHNDCCSAMIDSLLQVYYKVEPRLDIINSKSIGARSWAGSICISPTTFVPCRLLFHLLHRCNWLGDSCWAIVSLGQCLLDGWMGALSTLVAFNLGFGKKTSPAPLPQPTRRIGF